MHAARDDVYVLKACFLFLFVWKLKGGACMKPDEGISAFNWSCRWPACICFRAHKGSMGCSPSVRSILAETCMLGPFAGACSDSKLKVMRNHVKVQKDKWERESILLLVVDPCMCMSIIFVQK